MPGTEFDFSSLKLTHRPNQFLLAPEGLCQNATPHQLSTLYSATPDRVYAAWKEIVAGSPRTEIRHENKKTLHIEAVQRSTLFRFKDRINFAAFASEADQSTIAIYSRSHVGYSDLGANKARIQNWVQMLEQALANG